jgi:hypothetical protein
MTKSRRLLLWVMLALALAFSSSFAVLTVTLIPDSGAQILVITIGKVLPELQALAVLQGAAILIAIFLGAVGFRLTVLLICLVLTTYSIPTLIAIESRVQQAVENEILDVTGISGQASQQLLVSSSIPGNGVLFFSVVLALNVLILFLLALTKPKSVSSPRKIVDQAETLDLWDSQRAQ